jgi:hypothetical protein
MQLTLSEHEADLLHGLLQDDLGVRSSIVEPM